MTLDCGVCDEPGPPSPAERVQENWMWVDPDGIEGPLPPVMLCGDHTGDRQAVRAVLWGAE
ncbi:MAG TPA: hypothetical protein HA263_07870 [Methanoregulaceae archaeon]|nr:hypothetical protein [Methanoregulaceae archaeon]